MELALEHNGVTISISSEGPLNLAGLQDFLDSLGTEEECEVCVEWDDEEEYADEE